MQDTTHEILVWLPSPMGDAVLCTPALRAIRQHFKSCKISFFAKPTVREVLSPSNFNDRWLEQQSKNPFAISKVLKEHKFTHAILFKNSFASALATFLAQIPSRIGYAREGRGFLLTEKLHPPKFPDGKFEPISMIDYYLAIASWLGADTQDRNLELQIDPQQSKSLYAKLPEIVNASKPIVIIVPGGAFGPSKCWPTERFAQTADWLTANYNATVVISVSPNPIEKQIVGEICDSSKHKLINLAERPISLSQLKALFSSADLVISNDTGPRHIAIALGCKLVSLFGPNDPAWTETDYENEIQIVGNVYCGPCAKPKCKKSEHLCMKTITVEMVCEAAKELLENKRKKAKVFTRQELIETSKSFFIDSSYRAAFEEAGLTCIDAVFSFAAGTSLVKNNLAPFRSRLQFNLEMPPITLFLKRNDKPPILVQIRNWLSHRSRKSCGYFEFESTNELTEVGIRTPKIVSYGEKWGILFEKRSFIITEKIPNAESLEKKLPGCFASPATIENLKMRRNFIAQLATFVKRFHETNYRHRDLYFSHIFYDDSSNFYLIDLARAFKPRIWRRRFQIKDMAQLYYSAPRQYFSRTDRLRFYFGYTGQSNLSREDKVFIHKVINKVRRMVRHDMRHGRPVPFAN